MLKFLVYLFAGLVIFSIIFMLIFLTVYFLVFKVFYGIWTNLIQRIIKYMKGE